MPGIREWLLVNLSELICLNSNLIISRLDYRPTNLLDVILQVKIGLLALVGAAECLPTFVSVHFFYFGGILDNELEDSL